MSKVGLSQDYSEIITIEAGKRGGKRCSRGLRIPVYDLWKHLALGMTEEEILYDFPDLERLGIGACLAFAADSERRLLIIPPAWDYGSTGTCPRDLITRYVTFTQRLRVSWESVVNPFSTWRSGSTPKPTIAL